MSLDSNPFFWGECAVKTPTGFECKFCSKMYNYEVGNLISKKIVIRHVQHLAKVESNDADNCPLVSEHVQKAMQGLFEKVKPHAEDLIKKNTMCLETKLRLLSKIDSLKALLQSRIMEDVARLNYAMDNQNMEESNNNKFWEYAVKTPTGFMCKSCSKEYPEFNQASVMRHIEHLAKLESHVESQDVRRLQQQVSQLNMNMQGLSSNDDGDDDALLRYRNNVAELESKLEAKFDNVVALLKSRYQPTAQGI